MCKIEQNCYKTIPKILFYKNTNNQYKMIDTANNVCVGELMVSPRDNELYINYLLVKDKYRRKGFGTKLVDFAKTISTKMGYSGRLRCLACITAYDEKKPSHIFYRKYGFTTDDKSVLENIDNAIKEKRQLDCKSAPLTYMYYPEK